MKDESTIDQEVQLEARKYGAILLRNNSGAFKTPAGRWVFFGLGNISKKHGEKIKSLDRIGITPVVITQAMVGQTIGVFTAVEMKEEAWKRNPRDARENAQEAFINWVKIHYGFAGFANSIDSFRKIIQF